MSAGAGIRRRLGWPIFGLGLLLVASFFALGIWQVQRLAWKTALIERVEAGLAAPGQAAPTPAEWPALSFDIAEYRRVSTSGHYIDAPEVLVQAVTAEGAGFWVMAPFDDERGFMLFINRGFVPADRRAEADRSQRPEGKVDLRGLLRLSQPGGGFLRHNDPALGRWFSRDTAAMASALGLGATAPYFLDIMDRGDGLPTGGLTVVSFPNNHLGYALTWFALAAGLLWLLIHVQKGAALR